MIIISKQNITQLISEKFKNQLENQICNYLQKCKY